MIEIVQYSKAWAVILRAVATEMDADDPGILAVMYGEEVNHQNPQVVATTDHKKSTAFKFFFVIFGLVQVYAIATASVDTFSRK